MNKDKYVFAQMIESLDNNNLLRIVKKYYNNEYVKLLSVGINLLL